MSELVGAALAAAASRLGTDSSAVLARLDGSIGDAARAAARDLASLDDAAKKRRRAEVAARARTPSLASIRGVHPTWVEATLAELPARARTAIAGSATDEIDVWLARWVLASLPPMPETEPFDRTRFELVAHDQLAFALGSAAASVPALQSAVIRIAKPPRAGGLGAHRAALERCRGASLDDGSSLLRVAARALAPHLDPLRRLQITRRMPYAEGRLVEAELVAAALAPLASVPTWAALTA